MKLKIYYMRNQKDVWGTCIVAQSFREAKILFKKTTECDDFLSIRGKRIHPNPEIRNELEKGELNTWIGLFHRCYLWITDNCPYCSKLLDFKLSNEIGSITECQSCHKQFNKLEVLKLNDENKSPL